jgi:hypothetical protein
MKKTLTLLTLAAVTTAGVQSASAGDREWATVGKVLTGIAAAHVITRAFEPAPACHTTVYYPAQPAYVAAPPPVVYAPPAPVYVQPPGYYVQPAPVYYVQPAPVVVYSTPVCAPRPLVSVNFGFGHGRSHGHRAHHHGWR